MMLAGPRITAGRARANSRLRASSRGLGRLIQTRESEIRRLSLRRETEGLNTRGFKILEWVAHGAPPRERLEVIAGRPFEETAVQAE